MPGSPKKFWKKFHEANVKQLSYQFEAFFKQLDQQVESKVSKKKKKNALRGLAGHDHGKGKSQ